jgi:hypothetical protein
MWPARIAGPSPSQSGCALPDRGRAIAVESIDERTASAPTVGAPGDGFLQNPLHRLQVRDLGADIGQVRGSEGAGFGAGTRAMIRQVEELPDLGDRESEGASPTDEREPLEVFGPVEAIASDAAGGCG